MLRKLYTLLLGLSLTATAVVAAEHAWAALGGSADSILSDRKAMSAIRSTSTERRGYTIEEMVSESTTVREFISSSGVVFGVAWNGLTHPDLTMLLGSYASEYEEALQRTPRKPGRRYHQVKTNRFVVEKWGHMRNLQGRAYAPALVPPGVNIDEIK
jgi:hypothetical protein